MTNKEIEKELEALEVLIYLATKILKDAIDLQAIAYKMGDEIRIAKLEEAIEVFENRLYMHTKRRDELFSKLLGENENE
ncbi:hypothetical protein [Vibrio aestuarianus]|uniref:Phage protein n=1 Tax=Vibrio aestuarianus TaxID=28171 RepID=A0ABM9FLU3_9VIBR|nr:hypothetical protein [Vibrio aestuarianus]MDE1227207.1 hypothetical protein [Vibrio aestuarianus]MDE1255293.1 hypothetical protein [Vibrio aestuarianus]MDE1270101.1 hypothetical protein [Vibrio aestuarianus]MDE1307751.1 hypothetical protein [Vibrio aestuarianus]MDH5893516.1 hypothetical protein [Vibrio aestuarianus]